MADLLLEHGRVVVRLLHLLKRSLLLFFDRTVSTRQWNIGSELEALSRMLLVEDLPRSLAELSNVHLVGLSLVRITDLREVYEAFVRVGMVNIVVLYRVLLVPESQVNPFVKVVADVFTLESLSVLLKEISGGLGPRRQLYMLDSLPIRSHSKIKG